MSKSTQKVALPAYLRKRLIAYRTEIREKQLYIIKDSRNSQYYKLKPWQFFILEVLPGCNDFEHLASIFEDKYGKKITQEKVQELFELIAENKLFGLSALSHPVLVDFHKYRKAKELSTSDKYPSNVEQLKPPEDNNVIKEEDLPAGIKDAEGLDDALANKGWKLFNPTGLINILKPILYPLRYLIYILPILVVTALFLGINRSPLISAELVSLWKSTSLLSHIVFSMLTVNLIVVLCTAVVASQYRATVNAFCIVLYMGFFPRFMTRIGHVKQMSRRERIWLHATPLMIRLGLLSAGLLLWFNLREISPSIAQFYLSIFVVGSLSFFITINPLVKSNGYHLVAAYLDEPHLRGKAYKALMTKIRGDVYKESNSNIMAAYALASTVFMILVIGIILILVGSFLKLSLGGTGIVIALGIAGYVFYKMIKKFQQIGQMYDRAQQFDKWRKRTLHTKEEKHETVARTPTYYATRATMLLLIALLLLPYNYEPGGFFLIRPAEQQKISSEVGGLITEIYFDGGETITKGTKIAQLSNYYDASQIRIYKAKIKEQEAYIEELLSMPRPEDIDLAESSLEVEQKRSEFSYAKVKRLRKLYKQQAVSYEDLDSAEREHQVNLKQVEEKRSHLNVVKLGTNKNKLDAERAKLLELHEELEYYNTKIGLSSIVMPFDGVLVAMYLKQKQGTFLEKGDVFATAENTDKVHVQIDVPQSDVEYVNTGAEIRFRPTTYQGEEFVGVVDSIDDNVTQQEYGKMVMVIATFDNRENLLRSGMTGYAKINTVTMPVIAVFTRSILRFFQIEAWSWIP
ncbi:MAG: efflux RND transporter periplasmic adaptor subunit [Candidatus Thiodiazotropha sp.]